MRMQVSDRKGNVSVFLAMAFVSLVLVVSVMVRASAMVCLEASSNLLLQQSGRSVLSEFHMGLKDYYGIIAFKGDESMMESRMRFYMEESFKGKGKSGNFSVIKPRLEEILCLGKGYCLIEKSVFLDAVEEAVIHKLPFKGKGKGRWEESQGELRNEKIRLSLPSKKISCSKGVLQGLLVKITGLGNLTELDEKGIILDYYIEDYFNCNKENRSRCPTFFQNEMEYVLYGEYGDDKNKGDFLRDFVAVRLALNSIHLYQDREKQEEIMVLAEVLTPLDPFPTAILITEGWALAESINDKKLLDEGKKVALYKKPENWAISLSSIEDIVLSFTEDDRKGKGIPPRDEKGMDYKDYLKLFLKFMDIDTKAYRTMDLIQLNIQGNMDPQFYMEECHVGFLYRAVINGVEYEYIQKY